MQTFEYIKSDLMRYCGKTDFITYIHTYISSRTFRYQCYLRCANAKGLLNFWGKVMTRISPIKRQIQISPKTKIGYGLYIGHGGPVIINPTAVIGNNVNLSQFLTIGSNEGNAAIIGDNVYIGPNVCIIENVKIGNNVTIGAGSVVTKDLPDNCTAAGNYAKVLNYNDPGRYISNRWEI